MEGKGELAERFYTKCNQLPIVRPTTCLGVLWDVLNSLFYHLAGCSSDFINCHFQPDRAICWDSHWQGSPFLGAVNFFGLPLTFFPSVLFTMPSLSQISQQSIVLMSTFWLKWSLHCYIFAFEPESSEMAFLEEISAPMPGMKRRELSAHLKLGHVSHSLPWLQRHLDFVLKLVCLWEAHHYTF